MVTANEAVRHAAEENAKIQEKQRRAKAKPEMELLHHLNYTKVPNQVVTVAMIDGASIENAQLEWVFADGTTIFADKHHRTYVPLTAVKSILMHNLADARPRS
jgi:hypothetical protein